MFDHLHDSDRKRIVSELEEELRPLLQVSTMEHGYDCCGCHTYDDILDHAIAIILRDDTTCPECGLPINGGVCSQMCSRYIASLAR